jgi:hypothetical protein
VWETSSYRINAIIGSWFQLCHVFGGFLVEIIEARFAAQAHFCALMREDMGFSHAVEFLTGDDASGERVGAGIRGFATGGETEAEEEYGDGFHGVDDGWLFALAEILRLREVLWLSLFQHWCLTGTDRANGV